jgi:MYXO-CTERM domain-containing protein
MRKAWGPAIVMLGLVGIPAAASAQAAPLMTVSAASPGPDAGAQALVTSGSVLALGSTSEIPTMEWLVVRNAGTADLTVSQVDFADVTSCTVQLSFGGGLPFTASPGTGFSLGLRITPLVMGPYSFTARITSNDLAQSPFTVPVTGLNTTAIAPVIYIAQGNGSRIPSGGTLNLGTTPHWTFTVAFFVGNAGYADLTQLGAVAAGALSNCTVVIAQPTRTTLNVGETTPFHVDVSPIAGKALSFTLTLPNSDPNQSPYSWTIQGNAEPLAGPVDPDAGADGGFDATVTSGAGGATGASGAGGATGTSGVGGATGTSGGGPGQGGGQAPSTGDAGRVPTGQAPSAPADTSGCGGCAVASSSGPLAALAMFALMAMALTRRRRRS